MNVTKSTLTAAAFALAVSFVAFQPSEANAMPRVHFDAQSVQGGNVVKAGWKKRRFRRFVRRHLRHHWRHRHGYGHWHRHGYGCHAHSYKVPGMHIHTRYRCGHRHFRAYDSWYWK